ncbi:MAG: glycosyltransferase family 2 protein [Pseudomonadota bacterium]
MTATWNCKSTIVDCLNSIAQQTYPLRQHIVVDGGSNDGTLELLNLHREQISNLVSEPDQGIYDALNKGIGLSAGEVIGFLHADDLYENKNVLAEVAAAFKDPAVSAVYGDLQYVKKENIFHVVRQWNSCAFSTQRLARGWMPPHPTLYVRREYYEKIGRFDLKYQISADYFSILQLFGIPNFKTIYLPRVLVKMRVGGISNRSLRTIVRKSLEDWDALRRSGWSIIDAVTALAWKNLSKTSQFFQ